MEGTVWWPHLCGNNSVYDAFWCDTITINTTNPDFTECFQITVLTWIPVTFLAIFCLVSIPYVSTSRTLHKWGHVSRFNLFKMVIGCMLVVISIADITEVVMRNSPSNTNQSSVPAAILGCGTRTLGLVMAAIYTHWTYRHGFHTSGVLFVYWFLMMIIGIIRFRSRIMTSQREGFITDQFQFVTFYIHFSLVVIQFLCALWPDGEARAPSIDNRTKSSEDKVPLLSKEEIEKQDVGKICPKDTSSFLSCFMFFWFTSLVWLGFKRTLVYEDIWDIRYENESSVITATFEKHWEKELKNKQYSRKNGRFVKDSHGSSKRPSVMMVLFRCFGRYYMLSGLLFLIMAALQLINPQLLKLLIDFIENGDPFTWHGYVYAFAMWIVSMASVITMHHGLFITFTVGLKMRTAVITAIYRKSLRLSSASRKTTSSGEIVNLMSVDAQKIQDFVTHLQYLWVAPVQIAFTTYFLWQIVGAASLASLLWYMLVIPLNSIVLSNKIRQCQIEQMKLKDARIKLVNQVLIGIKVLKLYAWEPYFRDKILSIRKKELVVIRKVAILSTINYIITFISNLVVALIVFTTYILTSDNGVLTPNKAFVTLALLNTLTLPLGVIPTCVLSAVQGLVSFKRLANFLLQDEVNTDDIQHDIFKGGAITIENGTFSWYGTKGILKDLNVNIEHNSLVAVVGQVGCGKSSLLSAILGEMIKVSGSVNTKGSMAYVAQQAWIQNLTVRDNIMFSKDFQHDKYHKVLDACALTPDLKILPGGDMTEIGERGINLSGGQKQRVSLARAVYQNADVYLLDDPLSAVDSHVGKHIFNNVIGHNGILKNKTRVLVTNSVTFLPKVDRIIVMKEGVISEMGTYEELVSRHGAFAEFIETYFQEHEDSSSEDEERTNLYRRFLSSSSGTDDSQTIASEGKNMIRRRSSTKKSISRNKEIIEVGKSSSNTLISEETAEEGNIQMAVIKAYAKAASMFWTGTVVLGLLLCVGGLVGNNIWLSKWSNDSLGNISEAIKLTNFRLGIYGLLVSIQVFGVILLGTGVAFGCVSAATNLHSNLLTNIVKCPMSFFDTTPLGRILNRFSKDVDTLDSDLRMYIQTWLASVSPVISTIVVIVYSTPLFIVVVIPLAIIFVVLQKIYIKSARQIKRIDSIKRSPVYGNFSETLNGVSTIRAYSQQDRFINNSDILLNNHQKVWFAVFSSNRWIGIWAEMLGETVVLFAAIFCILQRSTLDPGTVGLSLSFALQASIQMLLVLRSSCELETYIVAVERIQEYTESPQEAPWVIEDNRPLPSWPSCGGVSFSAYCTRYRHGLDLVLKGVQCDIKHGEKIGIVGRTGAGKSSMTLALFRIIEATSGAITIDGENIGDLGLHDIRSKLTIIPQDPILFSGSVQFNIDPAGSHTDDAVWRALEQAHLKSFVASLEKTLQYECGEDGKNLSVGQKQLVCLARALLRKTKILVLDEATAAVDLETDDLIQSTIRAEFKESTVITIAHRLNTIMDYDRVMVMDAGLIKEFNSPSNLLKNTKSMFYGMAKDAGLV